MGLSLHMSIIAVIMMVVSLQVWLPLGCFEEERTALLQLKDSLNYPNGTSLPSWRKVDARCCHWELVRCSSSTGRVTGLYLYGVRNGELGDWYLNASLFLPFQELVTLILMDNQIAGWVENKGVYQPFKMNKLTYLDLGYNRLDNNIVSYVDGLWSLKLLYIDYNRLEGLIDLKECSSNLETLYLSGNNITKVVASGGPTNLSTLYLNNITSYGSSFQTLLQSLGALSNLIKLDLGYNDLRGRRLGDGEIPPEIGNLSKIKVLNLSHNSLIGPIPPTFSRLKEIESLDLSYNKLEGEIPPQLTGLYSLVVFSVAHNNLSGKIFTRVAQFSTFKESSYKDNPFLCGQPLTKACDAGMPSSPMPTPTSTNNKDNGGFMDMEVFYVSFEFAYIMVLLVVGAVLYINPCWRRAWFHFIEVSITNCYYFVVDILPIRSKFGFS